MEREISVLNARRIVSSIDNILQVNGVKRKSDPFQRMARRNSKKERFIFKDEASAVSSSFDELVSLRKSTRDLLGVKYFIRLKVDEFNHSSDISSKQNQSNLLQDELSFYTNHYEDMAEPSYDPTNSLYSKGFSDEHKKSFMLEINRLKREIQNISDECVVLNTTGKIIIPDSFVSILEDYNLI